MSEIKIDNQPKQKKKKGNVENICANKFNIQNSLHKMVGFGFVERLNVEMLTQKLFAITLKKKENEKIYNKE